VFEPHEPWEPQELLIDLSPEEVLEDLCWPGRPPGSWDVPRREVAHVDALLRAIEGGAVSAAPARRRRRVA